MVILPVGLARYLLVRLVGSVSSNARTRFQTIQSNPPNPKGRAGKARAIRRANPILNLSTPPTVSKPSGDQGIFRR
jgi:hypothetical protein